MKKIFLISIFLLTASCAEVLNNMGCGKPTFKQQKDAKWYYNHGGARIVSSPSKKITDLFGCHYYKYSDTVYSYSTFFHKGYVLVRKRKPIMSVDSR